MAIRSGFFNSVNGDRKYDARRFAEYFATFIGNGVFPNPSNNLQVVSNNDMTVTIKAGKAWINGYILVNDDDYTLTLDPADGVLNRVDRVVLRYDVVDREIRLEVKKGVLGSSPMAQALQRDADAYELALADIYVGKGAISITQASITDQKLNTSLCGIVHGVVDQVDTTTLFNQYLAWLNEKKSQYNADMINWTTQKQDEYNTWTADKQAEYQNWYNATTTAEQQEIDDMQDQFQDNWDTWFATVQDTLDGDTAGNLLNLINANSAAIATKAEQSNLEATNTNVSGLQTTVDEHLADSMPHKFVDGDKVYGWGFRTVNGQPQFIYEEVVE